MLSATLSRFGVVCGVVAGLLLAVPSAVEAVTGEIAATSFLLGLAPALALPLLVVLHLRQRQSAGTFGAVAYTVNLVGLGLFGGAGFTLNMTLFYLDGPVIEELLRGPTRLALLGSAVVFAVGAVLFGISLLRARIHPRVPSVAYLVALPALALAAPLPDTLFITGLHVVAGMALCWLAMSPASTATSAAPARSHAGVR